MKSKLTVIVAFTLLTAAALYARAAAEQSDCERIKSIDATARVIKLDLKGRRGVVTFRPRHHEAYLNPDSQFAHQSQRGAERIGCPHTRTESRTAPPPTR